MPESTAGSNGVVKYRLQVDDHGRVELDVPFAPGARVVVLVAPDRGEGIADLTTAAESSLGFWDNPLDDEDWNDA
jgi:hypothetical protein